MKKLKYILITILLSLSLCTEVSAKCTEEEKKHFKEIESSYKVTYEYDENTKKYSVTYYMPEVTSYIYGTLIKDTDGTSSCEVIDVYTIKCTGKNWEDSLEYTIKGNTKTCDDTLKTGTVTIKKKNTYNKYSESELCQGIEDFVLCQPNYDKEITKEEFESRVETYKNSLEKKENEQTQDKNNPSNEPNQKENTITLEKIINYIKDNIITIAIILVFIVLSIITIILVTKNIKKSRRLE